MGIGQFLDRFGFSCVWWFTLHILMHWWALLLVGCLSKQCPHQFQHTMSNYADSEIRIEMKNILSQSLYFDWSFNKKTTCLGKISRKPSTEKKKFGVREDYSLPPGELRALEDHLDISPNEVMFVKKSARQGILPRMLTEILEARIKVKKEMKKAAADPVLYRILNAKQFALKLIANVTYGYTSASFSGRMPCSDIADAIVGYGRLA